MFHLPEQRVLGVLALGGVGDPLWGQGDRLGSGSSEGPYLSPSPCSCLTEH